VMEIKPLIGVDDLMLGMSRDEVSKLLGEPDKKGKALWSDTTKDETWEYYEFDLEANFYEDDDFLLGTIDINSPNAVLEDKKPIGESETKFL